jgi:hypothetical protein
LQAAPAGRSQASPFDGGVLGQFVTHVHVPSAPQVHCPSLNMQFNVGVSHESPLVGAALGQSL